jgi:hypothetical protein
VRLAQTVGADESDVVVSAGPSCYGCKHSATGPTRSITGAVAGSNYVPGG